MADNGNQLGRAWLEMQQESKIPKPFFKITGKDLERGIKIRVKPRGSMRGAVFDKISDTLVAEEGKDQDTANKIAIKALTMVYEGFSKLSSENYAPFLIKITDIKKD